MKKLHRVYDGKRPAKKLKYTLPVSFEFFLLYKSRKT